MNVLARLGEMAGQALERRELTMDPALLAALRSGGGAVSSAGVSMSVEKSLTLSAVAACVRLITSSLASVPLVLMERKGERRTPAEWHPLYTVLHDLANPLQTALEWREMLFANVLLWGNAYSEIEFDRDGYPVALWPMSPDRVGVEMTREKRLIYTYYSDDFGGVTLPAHRVHHVRDLALRGVVGLSRMRHALNALGLAAATETFGAQYFANGAQPSVVLSHPTKLSPEAMKNLRSSFEAQMSGLSNAHRLAVVGEAVKIETFGVPPEEAQFLETRKFQVAEVARIFNVPLLFLNESQTATYASAEQDMLRWREVGLGPLAERHEKTIYRDLLTTAERKTMYAKYKLDKLAATDLKTRYEIYKIGKESGLLTTDEARAMEDMDPKPGGDILWMPLNMAPAEQVAKGAGKEKEAKRAASGSDSAAGGMTEGWGAREAAPEAAQPVIDAWLAETERRFRARVANDVRLGGAKALRKGGKTALEGWIDEMRSQQWVSAGMSDLQPLMNVTLIRQPMGRVRNWIEVELMIRRAELEAQGASNETGTD